MALVQLKAVERSRVTEELEEHSIWKFGTVTLSSEHIIKPVVITHSLLTSNSWRVGGQWRALKLKFSIVAPMTSLSSPSTDLNIAGLPKIITHPNRITFVVHNHETQINQTTLKMRLIFLDGKCRWFHDGIIAVLNVQNIFFGQQTNILFAVQSQRTRERYNLGTCWWSRRCTTRIRHENVTAFEKRKQNATQRKTST